MHKIVYRIMSLTAALTMALGGYASVKATPASLVPDQQAVGAPRVYAYYYLWWSAQHWYHKLGPGYPYAASPLPLPAVTDADGCNAVSNYPGNQLLDIPTTLVSQDDLGAIESDIVTAKNAGISGFWLNWVGDGTPYQSRFSVT